MPLGNSKSQIKNLTPNEYGMNKSKSSASSLKNIQFDEDWSSHPAVEWLSAHKNLLLWALFALIALLIVASKWMTWRTLDAEKDFFQAQAAFTQFQQTATNLDANSAANPDLEQLLAIMQRHPELKPKYEGPLAQTLLLEGQIPQAQAFVEDIFTRTNADHLQIYQDYTQTSLFIGQGLEKEALQHAQQLKLTLDQLGEGANPLLYVFNLIRLALLYQHTGQTREEWKTWEELQNSPQRAGAILAADQVLKVGQASLNQYIEERKKALSP